MTAVAAFGMIGAAEIEVEALTEPVQRRDDARIVRIAAKLPRSAEV